ncbi:hypothetical protein [Noviherbaspirillum sp. ST9]|uniref:hypothetical protein n=1 Tax=Noviherbaspirillum sp. ST9 TaxID=3401606 RepID=UPI003B586D8E
MTIQRPLKTVLAALIGALFLHTGVTIAADAPAVEGQSVRPARPPETKEQIERRLTSVSTLLETSSGAKQIETSGNAQAQAQRAKARDLHKQADAAYQKGDLPAASRLLDEAAKTMFDGVRQAAPEQVSAEKKQRDFDNRLESVKALLSAQKRISAEKKLGAKGAETTAKIEAQIREAQALAASGKIDEGKAALDKVYGATRASIETMREGDTLVRSLNFATKEEEYHYEIDRNDTHKMLVKVLLEEKRASNPNLESMVQKYVEQAATLRTNAEGMAAKKDYEGAIKVLEDSTKELVRAIRGAGVYIPG